MTSKRRNFFYNDAIRDPFPFDVLESNELLQNTNDGSSQEKQIKRIESCLHLDIHPGTNGAPVYCRSDNQVQTDKIGGDLAVYIETIRVARLFFDFVGSLSLFQMLSDSPVK